MGVLGCWLHVPLWQLAICMKKCCKNVNCAYPAGVCNQLVCRCSSPDLSALACHYYVQVLNAVTRVLQVAACTIAYVAPQCTVLSNACSDPSVNVTTCSIVLCLMGLARAWCLCTKQQPWCAHVFTACLATEYQTLVHV